MLADKAAAAIRERDAALAANAEMRAALTEIIARGQEQRGTGRMIETAEAALSRTDLGRGWASPEVVAQMVGALQVVESDGEFDLLHEVTCKFVVDALARLKAEVETAKAWQGAAVLRNYDAVRILTEEIGAPGPENIDETARRAVMVIRAHKRALAAGPAALRKMAADYERKAVLVVGQSHEAGIIRSADLINAAMHVEDAQEAAMKEDGDG